MSHRSKPLSNEATFSNSPLTPILAICLVLLAGCGGGGGDAGGTPPSDPGAGDDNGGDAGNTGGGSNQGDGPDVLDLNRGDEWTYTWMTQDDSTVQGSGSSSTSDYGTYTITVGQPGTIAGVDMHSIILLGETPASVQAWTHLGSTGSRIVGSRDGVNLETVFDFSGQSWSGGGWFHDWGTSSTVDAGTGHLSNDFIELHTPAAGLSTSEGGCQYFSGAGTICTGDDEWNIRQTEFAKEGVGMLGYSSRVTYTSNGGGFFTSFTKRIEIGLTATNLVGHDGWVPNAQIWSEGSEMQTGRMNFGAAASDGKIFVFGGSMTNSYAATSSVECYDPATDSWSARSPLPSALYDCTAAALNGFIFVYGTENGGEIFFGRYDPDTDHWLPITGAPGMSRPHAVAHTGLQMIMFATDASGGATPVATILYAPNTNEWLVFTSGDCTSHAPRHSTFGFAGDGQEMYVVGGFRITGDIWNPQDETTRVRKVTGVGTCWEGMPSLGVKRQGLACAMVGEDLFAIGGRNGSLRKTTVEVFSTQGGGGWEEISGLLSPRSDHCAVTLDGKIHVLGGRDDDGFVTGTQFILDPSAL